MRTDTVGRREVSCPNDTDRPKPYPALISRALELITVRPAQGLVALSPKEKIVLCMIVKVMDVRRPCQSIRVSNQHIADELMVSTRTITRVKGALEEKGWIARSQRISRRWGAQISDVSLSSAALDFLGMAQKAAEVSEPSVGNRAATAEARRPTQTTKEIQRQTKMTDAYLFPQFSMKRHSGELSVMNELPADVADLERVCGISRYGVWALMRMASKAGRRLGAVVCDRWHLIKKSVSPFAYVRALVSTAHQGSIITSCVTAEPGPSFVSQRSQGPSLAGMGVLANEIGPSRIMCSQRVGRLWRSVAGVVYSTSLVDAIKKGVNEAPWAICGDSERVLQAVLDGRITEWQGASV